MATIARAEKAEAGAIKAPMSIHWLVKATEQDEREKGGEDPNGVARPELCEERASGAEDVQRQEAVVAVVPWKNRPSSRPCTGSSVESMSSTSRSGGRPCQESMNNSASTS